MRDPSREANRRSRHRLEPPTLRPVAEDDQREGGAVCRLDGPVDALVGHQPPTGEVVRPGPGLGREQVQVHRRIHHVGGPAVDTLDPLGDEPGVGDERVDALGAPDVLPAKSIQHGPPEERGSSRAVLLVEVP